MNAIFYIAAAVAIFATIVAISHRNAVHALLNLIISLLAVAVIFYVLGAPFAAALEVIVYAGAIMVLFVFVIMMLNLGPRAEEDERRRTRFSDWVLPGLLGLVLLVEVGYLIAHIGHLTTGQAALPPAAVGASLYTTYLLGVEIASLVLLAGLVGAYHIGRRHHEIAPQEGVL